MEVGDRVRISGTNSFWDGREGLVEWVDEDNGTCTVFVDFDPENNKRVRQDFALESLSLTEAYRVKSTGQVGDIVKSLGRDYALFMAKDGSKSQVAMDDLEEYEEGPDGATQVEFAPSFERDLITLDDNGRGDEMAWFLEDGKGSLEILRYHGFDGAIRAGRIEQETRSNNNSFKNPNNITVYALKKGINSHNQFRAYFYRDGNKCVFVRGHMKKRDDNGPQEYRCIQDTIDYANSHMGVDKR